MPAAGSHDEEGWSDLGNCLKAELTGLTDEPHGAPVRGERWGGVNSLHWTSAKVTEMRRTPQASFAQLRPVRSVAGKENAEGAAVSPSQQAPRSSRGGPGAGSPLQVACVGASR